MDDALTYADMFRVLAEPVSQAAGAGLERRVPTKSQPAPLTRAAWRGRHRRPRRPAVPRPAPARPFARIRSALLDERDGLFFSGDAIYDDTLIDDLPDSDRTAYRATMARILDLPVRIAYGGHGESFSGERMREIARRYIEARRRHEAVAALLPEAARGA